MLNRNFAWLFLLTAACGETVPPWGHYLEGHPGSDLPEGGEALLEVVHYSAALSGGEPSVVNTFHAFQFGGVDRVLKTPQPGECTRFEHPMTFPVQAIPDDADYVDWGASVRLTGDGLGEGVSIPKVLSDGTLTDNRPSPVRHHPAGTWLYGGPTWQGTGFQNVTIEPGGNYALELPEKRIDFNFPKATAFALDAGEADVIVPASGDMTVTWEADQNPPTQHSRTHSFVFVALAQFPGEGDLGPTPLFMCQPPEGPDGSVDGELTIPEEVLAEVPDQGIFQTGRFTHWGDALTDNDGVERRFDVFSIWCSVSTYSKQ